MVTHKDLDVWKLSIALVKDIYMLTEMFPPQEQYGLTNQLRRASVSVPSNIAEGSARNSLKEFIQFCYISLGSLSEIETQTIIACELDFVNREHSDKILKQIEIIRKKLLNFIKHLKIKGTNNAR
ncbi:four helix bundle protein [Sulfurovum sp. ST-21]|uniref:Four helix bundle protein n=1 Tax=Sulfurovum indicum TaxID=2779528 RepID=A0A7M1S7A8_9BACT|nr:four helix bundle protein [Sulfurovum indicum]QOR62599.1 four helix bundle protein [Sulfurovum indicum]